MVGYKTSWVAFSSPPLKIKQTLIFNFQICFIGVNILANKSTVITHPSSVGVLTNGTGLTSSSGSNSGGPIIHVGPNISNNNLQNGVTRLVSPAPPSPVVHPVSGATNSKNVRTGLSSINNVLTTGGVIPGIKQATLSTLISGVGVNVPRSGASASPLPQIVGTAMTINTSAGGPTSTAGQAGQNQTVVLSKGTGVTMASTGTIGLSQNPPGTPTGVGVANQGQTIAIGAGTGLQILNMNNLNAVRASSVHVGAVSGGGSPQVVAAGPAGAKGLAPRMIISPQVLNTRPGQPGVSYTHFNL